MEEKNILYGIKRILDCEPIQKYEKYTLYQVYRVLENGERIPIYKECRR